MAVLRNEIMHRFQGMADKLDTLERGQRQLAQDVKKRLDAHSEDIQDCQQKLAVLEVTAIRIDVVKVTALISFGVLVVMATATVITKIAGVW